MRVIAIRSISLTNGLHFYEVAMCEFIARFDQQSIPVELAVIDSHWQESTARLCAQRWAEYYGCDVSNVPLERSLREVSQL